MMVSGADRVFRGVFDRRCPVLVKDALRVEQFPLRDTDAVVEADCLLMEGESGCVAERPMDSAFVLITVYRKHTITAEIHLPHGMLSYFFVQAADEG